MNRLSPSSELAALLAALSYFTRLPMPAVAAPEALGRAVRWLPLVGWIVGGVGAGVTLAAAMLWPPAVAIVLGMLVTLWLTGALHEDGLADSCDAFGGGYTPEQRLAIMKDSRIGSFGTLGLVMALLLKFTALSALYAVLTGLTFAAALLAAHAVSRLAPVWLVARLNYARADKSKAAPLAQRSGWGGWTIAAFCALVPCFALPALPVLLALAWAALVTVAAGVYFQRRLGGYTGDGLGAAQQVSELAFYLGLLCACI